MSLFLSTDVLQSSAEYRLYVVLFVNYVCKNIER